MQEILNFFEKIQDNRSIKGKRYKLSSILTVVLIAKMVNCTHVKSIYWFAKELPLKYRKELGFGNSVPAYQTFLNILNSVSVDELEKLMTQCIITLTHGVEGYLQYCMDGKALCGSSREDASKWHLVSAFCPEIKSVVHQVESNKGGGEIEGAQKVLENIPLKGAVVTGDAMFARSNLCDYIAKEGGFYAFAVKRNQAVIHDEIEKMFRLYNNCWPGTLKSHKTRDKGHGRKELREIEVMCPYVDLPGFSSVKHIGHITRRRYRYKREKVVEKGLEDVYIISNLPADKQLPQQLLNKNRTHWSVENNCHRTRDVLFREDASTLRTGKLPQVNACFNNVAYFILESYRSSIKEKLSLEGISRRFFGKIHLAISAIKNLFCSIKLS